ncbi:hypothetical protein ACWC9T_42070, partial [Kitasatospora sp. NPDC001159]
MTWSWEYLPSEQHVTAGAPANFLAAVEQRAAELVRAAEALYLDGTSYQGSGEPALPRRRRRSARLLRRPAPGARRLPGHATADTLTLR